LKVAASYQGTFHIFVENYIQLQKKMDKDLKNDDELRKHGSQKRSSSML
jgi:hypothetical protein